MRQKRLTTKYIVLDELEWNKMVIELKTNW